MLDPVLRAFVEAPDEAAAEESLGALLESRAVPLIRRIASHKLRSFARDGVDAEVEELTSDALLALVSRLQALRADPAAPAIENLDDYTATVTFHTFAHHLRRRQPERSRLKHRLRYALDRDRRLGLWQTAVGPACGLARWRPALPSADAAARLEALAAQPQRWSTWTGRVAGSAAAAASALREILLAAGGPVELDDLVGRLFTPPPPARTDTRVASLADTAEPADVALDRRRAMERLWREIGTLPIRQRVALLLNLRDPQGRGLLWVWPVSGVASLRQIAAALEMPEAEMAGLWSRLPLPDQDIAARLACTRQQVINLRAAARKRLAHRLDAPPRTERSRAAVNTGRVSASLEDEA